MGSVVFFFWTGQVSYTVYAQLVFLATQRGIMISKRKEGSLWRIFVALAVRLLAARTYFNVLSQDMSSRQEYIQAAKSRQKTTYPLFLAVPICPVHMMHVSYPVCLVEWGGSCNAE